ncbi:MAG: hypothetical protein J6039_02140 [Alphaproteobacteria bacterium]|nr:hypothetical protein [Alphaproteobacteria bacterium]
MLENVIYLSPLLILAASIFILMFSRHDEEEQYHCFRFSRTMLVLSFILSVIFYNKPLLPEICEGNKYTLLFECFLYVGAIAVLFLSRKWFASMKLPAYVYCGCIFISVLGGILLISSLHLSLTVVGAVLLMLSNYILLKSTGKKRDIDVGGSVYLSATVVSVILLCLTQIICKEIGSSLRYEDLRAVMAEQSGNPLLFGVMAAWAVVFTFLLALAPLHFWFTEILGRTILPVFAYFMLVPIGAYLAGFIRLNVVVFAPMATYAGLFYKAVALISLAVGAVGACSVQNVRKIFAYASVYHLGMVLLVLQTFTLKSISMAMVYLFTYLLAMYGICTSLFGLKIKGEYLFTLNEFEGAAHKRPYVAAIMTMFIFSLLGCPPFCGFLGSFSALNYIITGRHYFILIYALLTLVILSYSYLQIIKAIYFAESKENFDRADSGIYTAIMLNVLFMILLILKPSYLTDKMVEMLESLFA